MTRPIGLASETDNAGNVITYGCDAVDQKPSEIWKISSATAKTIACIYYVNGNQLTAIVVARHSCSNIWQGRPDIVDKQVSGFEQIAVVAMVD